MGLIRGIIEKSVTRFSTFFKSKLSGLGHQCFMSANRSRRVLIGTGPIKTSRVRLGLIMKPWIVQGN